MESNQPIHQERHVRIICIGAGASGLLFAYKLQRSFSNFSLVIYEKNPEVAGTWFENRYPGCACDVPSHNYTWSFEPKTDWSASYASSKEIFNYFDNFARKYGLRQYCRVRHQVIGAAWNTQHGGYDVRVCDLQSGQEWDDSCDILINAGGILNSWRWPAIPGLEKYKGTLVHTANWDDSIVLKGKHVGLIGNGSSGIQVLPAVLPEVRKVTTFIREPTWVSPVKGLEQHIFSEEEKQAFAANSQHLTEYRRGIERGMNGQFAIFLRNTEGQRSTREYMTQQMKEKLNNVNLEKVLIPDWSVGCRRITPGVGYLESLGNEKVKVVYGNITEVTERGCICDDGNEYPIDVLVCATGFDTSFRPRFPIIGPAGNNLQDEWKAEAKSYFGIAAAAIPNYLTFLGPNSPVGNGPVLIAVEAQADYMMKLIDRYQTTNIRSFAPTAEAVNDFIEFKDHFMRRTVWADGCRSWYKATDPNGPVTGLWPGSTLHYIEALNEVRLDDWEVKYNGNRFAWLGNGYSQTEIDETADWAYYIRDHDDGEYHSRNKRLRILNKSGTRQPEPTAFTVFPRI
ncbi:flavin-containing monooxygenase [Aspergillus foveolatus]|uniref:flavin-containing monooxygenase n=1 Tax=Aspergillus foveolatus TaxID=210207 RepID=UPI003CCE33F5